MSLPDVREIRQLLSYLPVEPQFAVSLEALQDIRQRNPNKPLPASHTETIEELRRIVYKSKDFQQTGLFEFHLALLFMEGSRYREAADLFALARRQWQFIDDISLDCLAHFGEALACQYNQEFDEAVDHYLKVQQFIDRSEDGTLPALWVEDDDELLIFINQTKKELDSATDTLRKEMRDAYQARLTHVAEVEPPIINETLKKEGHLSKARGDLELCLTS
jgi:tetratricopeptide (TPR) repeat protein